MFFAKGFRQVRLGPMPTNPGSFPFFFCTLACTLIVDGSDLDNCFYIPWFCNPLLLHPLSSDLLHPPKFYNFALASFRWAFGSSRMINLHVPSMPIASLFTWFKILVLHILNDVRRRLLYLISFAHPNTPYGIGTPTRPFTSFCCPLFFSTVFITSSPPQTETPAGFPTYLWIGCIPNYFSFFFRTLTLVWASPSRFL